VSVAKFGYPDLSRSSCRRAVKAACEELRPTGSNPVARSARVPVTRRSAARSWRETTRRDSALQMEEQVLLRVVLVDRHSSAVRARIAIDRHLLANIGWPEKTARCPCSGRAEMAGIVPAEREVIELVCAGAGALPRAETEVARRWLARRMNDTVFPPRPRRTSCHRRSCSAMSTRLVRVPRRWYSAARCGATGRNACSEPRRSVEAGRGMASRHSAGRSDRTGPRDVVGLFQSSVGRST
jgi:hypothetical protein